MYELELRLPLHGHDVVDYPSMVVRMERGDDIANTWTTQILEAIHDLLHVLWFQHLLLSFSIVK